MTANGATDTLKLAHVTPPGSRDDCPTHSETPPRLQVPLPDHEPIQAELEEEFGVLDLSLEQAREPFLRPIRFKRHKEP